MVSGEYIGGNDAGWLTLDEDCIEGWMLGELGRLEWMRGSDKCKVRM